MAISEAISPSISDAIFTSLSDTASASEGAEGPTPRKPIAGLLVGLLMLGVVGVLGYTVWWVPREQAQVAQVRYKDCLEEVKVYVGKRSYPTRLAQCTEFLKG